MVVEGPPAHFRVMSAEQPAHANDDVTGTTSSLGIREEAGEDVSGPSAQMLQSLAPWPSANHSNSCEPQFSRLSNGDKQGLLSLPRSPDRQNEECSREQE